MALLVHLWVRMYNILQNKQHFLQTFILRIIYTLLSLTHGCLYLCAHAAIWYQASLLD